MRSDQIQLLKKPEARQIYDIILAKGPITARQLGAELPDIPTSKRRGLMTRLHHVGLIRRTSDSFHHSIWEVVE